MEERETIPDPARLLGNQSRRFPPATPSQGLPSARQA
jgi:hypothetical protein